MKQQLFHLFSHSKVIIIVMIIIIIITTVFLERLYM